MALVDDDDCYWEPNLVDDFIDGEEDGVPFAKPIRFWMDVVARL